MKRCAVVLLFVAAVALSGCVAPPPSEPPAPTGPSAPAGLESMSVSPDPVVAGETFTFTVDASDDIAVTEIQWRVYAPADSGDFGTVECDGPFTPQPQVSVVYTCTMPAAAPSGSWTLGVRVFDGEIRPGANTPWGAARFEVIDA